MPYKTLTTSIRFVNVQDNPDANTEIEESRRVFRERSDFIFNLGADEENKKTVAKTRETAFVVDKRTLLRFSTTVIIQ